MADQAPHDQAPAPASAGKKKRSVPGSHSIKHLIDKHAEREDHVLLLRLAMDYAKGHKMGARKVVSTRLFPGVSKNQLHNAMKGSVKMVDDEARNARSVLTKAEQLKLAHWVAESATKKNPATDADISNQVVLMLRSRRADNRRRKHGRGCVALTLAEARLADEAGAEVSHTWLTHFSARFPWVRKQKERNADASRTKKQNEGVVTKHFYGEFGIVASLESIGNLNMDTKRVKDPRRVWWLDEMGQFLAYAGNGPRSWAWGIKGAQLERSSPVNRETASMGLCFCLDGFLRFPFEPQKSTSSSVKKDETLESGS